MMIPDNWSLKQLKEIALVTSGGTPSRTVPDYWGGNIPWVRTTEVQNCVIAMEDVKEFITQKGLDNSSAKMLPNGSILMAMIGQGKTRGQVALLSIDAACNQNSAAIVFQDGYSSEFFFNYLKSQYQNIRNFSNSAGQSNLSGALVKAIKVPVPPFPEQKKIAQILSIWDKAIETVEKLIGNSQQKKKALMQQLLTGKKRFPGFDGAWKKQTIEELENQGVITLSRGNVISKKDIAQIPGQYPIYSSSVKNNGLFGCYGKYMFDEELITWSVDGGGDFFYRSKHRFSVTNVSGYMRVDTDTIDYRFLAAQLGYLHGMLKFDYQTKAHPSVIRKLYTLRLPSIKEQKAITAVLSAADQEIETWKQELEHLKQEKKALMQQLLTGKRRVKVNEYEC